MHPRPVTGIAVLCVLYSLYCNMSFTVYVALCAASCFSVVSYFV
jgi:hypothetical protein